MIELVKNIICIPLLTSVGILLFSQKINRTLANIITILGLLIVTILSYIIFFYLRNNEINIISVLIGNWINSGELSLQWKLRVDMLTATMLVVVNTVSLVVHIYSTGYMKGDSGQSRFMAYLSLFTFFMILLVTADNLLILFLGWEGVGLCSYLLIGFWFTKDSANRASIKAFVTNRVGDFALLLAIILIFWHFHTLSFEQIFPQIEAKQLVYFNFFGIEIKLLSLIGLLLFIGAMGKSAQIGLHIWLPDAMEGPTPVSALIHAATMVTAGVFLIIRMSHLFEYSGWVLDVMTFIGAATAIFATIIALTQNDIKRVIAYSTCSQLGYMVFACGLSAYSAALFHLVTHAFFKALLFLCAGNVIHSMSNKQDIREMGGLAKKIPITYIMFVIGSLALAGFPPFAGFYSKDVILESAFMSHNLAGTTAYILGVISAFLTVFYSTRLLILVFHGKCRADSATQSHIHESPFVQMVLPLFILVVGSIFAGLIGYYILDIVGSTHIFFKGSIVVLSEHNMLEKIHHTPILYKYLPLIFGIIAVILAIIIYLIKPMLAQNIMQRCKYLYKISLNKFYIDEIYSCVIIRPIQKLSSFLSFTFDKKFIDDFGPGGAVQIISSLAKLCNRIYTGFIYHYALIIIFSTSIILGWIIIYIN